MKTKTYHITNLGSFSPRGITTDSAGYVTYHDSQRYAKATESQLNEWRHSKFVAVRNAALTEFAERHWSLWQNL